MEKGKISVRRELREPDAFMKTTYRVIEYLQEHRKLAIGIGVLVVVLLVTTAGTSWYLHNRRVKAEQALNQVLATLDSKEQKKAGELLEQVRKDFPDSKVGTLAAYLEANYRYQKNELDKAMEIYRSNTSEDRYLADLQQLGLAAVHYRQKDYGDAISILEKLLARQSFLSEDTYLLLGLSYEKDQKPEKALAVFENMIQLLPNSIFKPWAEEQRLRLQNEMKLKS
jgi:predicted negative regulator of RcsB-dependent stress response